MKHNFVKLLQGFGISQCDPTDNKGQGDKDIRAEFSAQVFSQALIQNTALHVKL